MAEDILSLSPEVCVPLSAHSVHQGGMPMTITHQHPSYVSEEERLERLRQLKRVCSVQLKKSGHKRTA